MIEWVRPGAQVVCIDEPNTDFKVHVMETGERHPLIGQIYTIRSVHGADTWSEAEFAPFLKLEEIRDSAPDGKEWTWSHRLFRPVKQTDISCFTSLLAPTPTTTRELEHA